MHRTAQMICQKVYCSFTLANSVLSAIPSRASRSSLTASITQRVQIGSSPRFKAEAALHIGDLLMRESRAIPHLWSRLSCMGQASHWKGRADCPRNWTPCVDGEHALSSSAANLRPSSRPGTVERLHSCHDGHQESCRGAQLVSLMSEEDSLE